MSFRLEIFEVKTQKSILLLENLYGKETILAIKKRIAQKKLHLPVERQSLRVEPKGKAISDETTLDDLGLSASGAQLYVKDLGPQIKWKTVFVLEYAGPLLIYPLFYTRPSLIYGSGHTTAVQQAVYLALLCWTFHYGKRLFETLFVHRFSNATMPFFNLIKNCGYYWSFGAFIAYYINHPQYTPPTFGNTQIYLGLAMFAISEFGNLSIHILQRNLRPAGSKERRIPRPDGNPLSLLYNYVSCPNYTYEVLSWIGFSVLTQSMPALLFTLAGFAQMAVWAVGKHKKYLKEFSEYPRERKAMIPYIL